jgi:hypothetical protein
MFLEKKIQMACKFNMEMKLNHFFIFKNKNYNFLSITLDNINV